MEVSRRILRDIKLHLHCEVVVFFSISKVLIHPKGD